MTGKELKPLQVYYYVAVGEVPLKNLELFANKLIPFQVFTNRRFSLRTKVVIP